jgi:hypothetical protein
MENGLENKIVELNSVIADRKRELQNIRKVIKERDVKKRALYADIIKRNKSIESKKKEKTSLNSQVSNLKESITQLTESKNSLKSEIKTLKTSKETSSKELNSLKSEIKNWESKSNLYTNDIEGISKSNKSEKIYYLIGAIVFGILMIITIKIPINQIIKPIGITWLEESTIFASEPQLSFYLLILLRVSIIVVSLIIIFIFLNLMKNFVSQFIKTEGRMNSVRSLLFLIEKIETSDYSEEYETDILAINKKIINEQVRILQENLPPIIAPIPSSFDKKEQVPWINFLGKKKNDGETEE